MVSRLARVRSTWRLAALSFSAMLLLSCDVGDQLCETDWLANDLTDSCPYGPPGGPQKTKQTRECPEIKMFDTSADCSSITFEGDVFPILTGNGNCTAGGCHGTEQDAAKANGLHFPSDITAQQMYDTLSMYRNPQGDAYWGQMNGLAWAECNLLATPGGGSPMPKPGGITDAADQASISKWIHCGMNPPGTGTGGAGTTSSTSTM